MLTLPATTMDVAEALTALPREIGVLSVLLSSIKFLARQGRPLRGSGNDSDSNFMQLFKLQGENYPRIAT